MPGKTSVHLKLVRPHHRYKWDEIAKYLEDNFNITMIPMSRPVLQISLGIIRTDAGVKKEVLLTTSIKWENLLILVEGMSAGVILAVDIEGDRLTKRDWTTGDS